MRTLLVLGALSLSSGMTGCIYANIHQPLSYRSPTPGDVGGQLGAEVDGKACNKLVLWLVAWGDGGYSAAVEDAKVKAGAALLADITADINLFNVLGVYQRSCTEVRGRVVQ